MKHTKEPWYFVDYAGYHELTDAPFYEAVQLLNEDDTPNAADNANRACECVNALTGIENPKEFIDHIKIQINSLESTSLRLEKALQKLSRAAELACYEFDDPNDATEAYSYLDICTKEAKSLLK